MLQTIGALGSDEVARQLDFARAIDACRWRAAWQTRSTYHPHTIRFDRPTRTLSVSLTGSRCALKCAHCGGHYLQHMRPIWDVQANGMTSCLISGGCDLHGRVPIGTHLVEVERLHQGRRLNWHVGLIDEDAIQAIAPHVDMVSFDLVGDAETAREVYGLDLSLDDYMRTLAMLRRYVPVTPHLTIGLRGGRLSGERAVLGALQREGTETLIFIILIPTPGTAYENCLPPAVHEVADLFLEAREMLPKTTLVLGCMRPHGVYRQAVDELAVRAGLNGIVSPARIAERTAAELGLEIIWGDECCALP